MTRRTGGEVQAAVRSTKARRKAGCEGECAGVGTARKVVKGKCPDECDDNILKALKEKAKKKAKKKADKDCERRAENCECSGNSVIEEEDCENQKLGEDDICVYYVTAIYAGECKKKTA